MLEILYCSEKELQGFYSIENAKMRYGWDFNLFETLKKVFLESYIVEDTKIKYG